MLRTLTSILLSACALFSTSQVIEQTLYINAGTMTVSDGSEVPYHSYNPTDEYNLHSEVITISEGSELELTIINNDDIDHGFTLDGSADAPATILPGESATFSFTGDVMGAFRFYDHLNAPINSYMGMGSAVIVIGTCDAYFVWNFRTHKADWNTTFDEGGTEDWSQYVPDYYTINNLSFPAVSSDPMANLTGSVGETLHIYMVNSGQSMHSMHFHGYHCEVISSSRSPEIEGSSKDTFALRPSDTMVIELIPNQPGIFPVHDHNLTAISGGGIYLNGGSLIFIEISE
jgi:FtsP/CotA-like multicopper oxidase with cupredoxin domain